MNRTKSRTKKWMRLWYSKHPADMDLSPEKSRMWLLVYRETVSEEYRRTGAIPWWWRLKG